MNLNKNIIAFTGGGTGGHIYPGLAVADELKQLAAKNGKSIQIEWIGCSKGMDKKIVESSLDGNGNLIADKFYGIPSGKLRRYFSMKNFSDIFRILGGFIKAFHILRKVKPAVLFSKGGFVSVPPVFAARLLKIPVYTHECDFTLGLANRLNFKSAKTMFVSYEETKNRLGSAEANRVVVTGNPVRPVFYSTNPENGKKFISLDEDNKKPVLLILGGSSGAKQINELVEKNLRWLCDRFVVVHQTGLVNSNQNQEIKLKEMYSEDYRPFSFIYKEMPDVLSCADVILSRAGANSIWEAAVLNKPMVLIPLCGSGTRGDQVDNAKFFEDKGAAKVLLGDDVTSENLQKSLESLLEPAARSEMAEKIKIMVGDRKSSSVIADYIYKEIDGDI